MNTTTEQTSVNYQFTAIPTNLFYLLNNNCKSTLFTLIQASSYLAKEDGYFFLTKESLCDLVGISTNLLTAALDTLYIHSIIYITTVGKSKGKYVNHYKVNFGSFKQYESLTFEDLKNPENRIEMVNYKNNYQPQYIKDYLNEGKKVITTNNVCNNVCNKEGKKVITNIDNINRKDKLNNNINNNLDNSNNINLNNNNKENNIINNITKEMELVETRSAEPQQYETKISILLDKLKNVVSLEEFEDKLEKFSNWMVEKGITPTDELNDQVNQIYNNLLEAKSSTISTEDEQSITNEPKPLEIAGKEQIQPSNEEVARVGMQLCKYKRELMTQSTVNQEQIEEIESFIKDNDNVIECKTSDLSKQVMNIKKIIKDFLE